MPSRLDQTQGDQGKEAFVSDDVSMVEASGAAKWSSEIDLDFAELGVPFLSLQQGLSKAVTAENSTVKMGDWLVTGFPEEKKVQVVPLQFGISRNYTLPSGDGSDTITQHCYSPTGQEHGIAVTELGPGIACAGCVLKEWVPSPTGEVRNGRKVNTPPPCKQSLDFLAYSLTHGTLVRVGFRSTGEKAGRQLAMLAKGKKLGNFIIELGSERQNNGRFTFAVPTVTILPPDQEALTAAAEMLSLPG